MSHCRLTDAQQAQITDLATAGHGPAEFGRRTGLTASQLSDTYKKLRESGRITARPRPAWKRWTPKETDKLIQLIEQGMSYPQVAKKLKRTETSIRLRAKRIGVRITTTKATMSARDVAAQLGIPCSKTVSRWITRGWLKASDAGKGRPLWRITWDDLTAFLETPAYWIAWQPARIPDPALKEWTHELRADEEPLLAHGEIAVRFGVGRDTVGQWIDKGWLPAVRYGNRRIPESALDDWVVPIDRKTPMNQEWPTDGWHPVGRTTSATFARRPA